MALPTILLVLRPLLAVLVVLSLIPWILRHPLGESTGFLRDLHSLLHAAEESKKLGPIECLVPDMTKLFLPTINRDFPVFNWPEKRITIEKRPISVLVARQALDLSKLVSLSESLRERVCLIIRDDRMNRLIRNFSGIVIRRTAITNYKNLPILTEICIVSSIGFLASLTSESAKKSKGKAHAAAFAVPHRAEASVASVLIHAQSVNVKSGYQKVTDISCPYCGTPLQCTDTRICPFCKSALVQTDSTVWPSEEIEFQTLI